MPIYEVQSLDVWGNARDGYEINDQRRIGEIYLRPTDIAEGGDLDIIRNLVNAGYLGEYAPTAFRDGDLLLEVGEEDIEVLELVLEDVEVEPDDDLEQTSGDAVQHEGERPLLHLSHDRQTWNEGNAEPFWKTVEPVMGYHHEDYELHITASYMVDHSTWVDGDTKRENEIPLIIFTVKPMIRGEPTAEGGPDSFQFFFRDKKWKKRIGFDPITSEPIKLSGDQVADLLVSLDKLMEEGPGEDPSVLDPSEYKPYDSDEED